MAQQQPLISGHDVLRLPETSPSAAHDPRDPIPGRPDLGNSPYLVAHPTNRKWVITLFDEINGVSPLITGVN